MSTIAWIILLVLLIPIIGVLIFVIVVASLVRVPSGSLGLVMAKGRATDTALLPGLHFLPAIRRRMVEEYPSVELAYRAGGQGDTEETLPDRARPLERSGPPTRFKHLDQSGAPWQVTLGDRTTAIMSVTVRFRLEPEHLRLVHERFGPNGIFGVVRDESSRAVMNTLGDPEFSIDSLFGKAREACQERLAVAVSEALEADGILLTALVLGTVDLGRTGEVIAATARARHELEREQAEAATRTARALNDADLQQHLTDSSDAAWRYRETDLWRELVQRTGALSVALRAGPGSPGIGITAVDQPGSEGQSEPVTSP
jgi:regulator of protease activity HflC (stomatin/prohibitin superfamily)